MSKTNILIIIIVIAVIGIGIYFALPSLKPIVSPGAPEETEVPAETEVPEETPAEETPSGEEVEEPEVQKFQGIEYKIITEGQITETTEGIVSGKKMMYEVVTGKLNEEKTNALAKKIITDVTSKDSEINAITMYFYSDKSLVEEMKIDVAIINWVPNEITVKMIEE